MSADTAISVDGVGKAYRIWSSPAARLTSPVQSNLASLLPQDSGTGAWLRRRAAAEYRDFWALKNISFEVKRGEAVGIIGRNGSGKSTLLQIIAGTLQPTSGSVQVHGRVAALLELGSGFNPEFTGRENVYLLGTIRGLTHAQIGERFDSIAAYAEIGDFIEQPVKTYSSGMTVRLAFAVCAHLDAEILIIDEALGVGDARFQLKCSRTIDRFVEEGRTLLFVSHDVNSVRRLCKKALLLECGEVLYIGTPNIVVNLYTKVLASPPGQADVRGDLRRLAEQNIAPPPPPASVTEVVQPPVVSATLAELRSRLVQLEAQLPQIARAAQSDAAADALLDSERAGVRPSPGEYTYGGELGTVAHCAMRGAAGINKTVFTTGEIVTVTINVSARDHIPAPIYALTIKSVKGQEIYGTNTLFSNQAAPAIATGEQARVEFCFPLNLIAGEYFLSVGWTQFVGSELVVVHRRYDVLKFTVLGIDRTFGIAQLFARITVTPEASK